MLHSKKEGIGLVVTFFKPVVIIVVILFQSGTVICQHSDSLRNIIQTTQVDTAKIEAMLSLGAGLMYDDLDSSRLLGVQALALADQLGLQKYIASSNSLLGVCYDLMGKFDSSMLFHEQALKIFRELENDKKEAIVYNNMGIVEMQRSNYADAIYYYEKAGKIYEKIDLKTNLAQTLGNIGNIYMTQTQFPEALEYYFQAVKILEGISADEELAYPYTNIGTVYQKMKKNKDAITYFEKSLVIDLKYGDRWGAASNYANMGIISREMKNHRASIEYNRKAINLYQDMGHQSKLIPAFNNLGYSLVDLYQANDSTRKATADWMFTNKELIMDSAIFYYESAIADSRRLGRKYDVIYNNTGLGRAYLAAGKPRKALINFKESLSLSQEIDALERAYNAHIGIAACYDEIAASSNSNTEKVNFLTKSIYHRDQYITLGDSIINEDKQRDIGKLEAQHEMEIAQLKREQEEMEAARLENERIERRYMLQYSGILLVLFALFGSLFYTATLKLPTWVMELSIFVPLLILFEFILVVTDPYMNSITGGEPGITLAINAVFAGLIFPLHNFLEKLIKARLVQSDQII